MAEHTTPRLGAWARADGIVGVVARVAGGRVTLFDPGQRRQHTVAADALQHVPSAAVRVTATVDVPLPHGLDETDLRRWMAMLTDPVLRDRARQALGDEQLDAGATLPEVTVTAMPLTDGALHCLCGAATPPGDSDTGACPRCGRQPTPPATPRSA